ncbi:MAG: hypothetical protein HY743_11875 [Deltaproteobacteria bacterium]|nr:hypothetical protein [Deltaproteobacteria bacterium]
MRKRMGLWVAVAVFSLLLPGSPALAGGKGQGQAIVSSQEGVQVVQPVKSPSGWSQGKKTGWQKKGAVTSPGLQKKCKIPPGHLK